MILVAVGTHHQPFDRLVAAAEALAIALDEPVVVQHGVSVVPTPHCERHVTLPARRFAALIDQARVVVLHAGSSSFLEVRGHGHLPVLVPRDPRHAEHVDDHQLRFAASVASEAVVTTPEGVVAAVRDHLACRTSTDPAARSRRFAERLDQVVSALVLRRG